MKKILSVLAVLGIVSFGAQSANAFCWSNLNPAYWGHCPKCQKVKKDCDCCDKKIKPCDEGITGGAAEAKPCKIKEKKKDCNPCKKLEQKPCEPCEKPKTPCEPCEKLQEMNK